MWRRRWIGLAIAWIVAVVGGVAVFETPDRYEASARIYVDTQSILKPLMSGLAVQPDMEQHIGILSRTLISRPNVERLIAMAKPDQGDMSSAEREALIDSLMRTLKISSSGRENLYTITYRDSDRAEATRVVQALVSIFVESSMGDKRQGSDAARRFIEEQIEVYEKKLSEAENRLKEFKLRHMGLMGDGRDYFAKMAALSEELAKARLELRATEQARDALKREVSAEDPLSLPDPGLTASGSLPMSELDGRIDTLKKTLDDMLRKYTDEHPDVTNTRRLIAQLELEKRQELDARKKALAEAKAQSKGPAILTVPNPIFQQLKVALAESEANVASLRGRVGELDARYRQLQAAAKQLPAVEAELAQLNRDYDVQKRNYESLVARRESAAMTKELDATGIADFRIIDPPTVPQNPVAPNRMLLLPLVLLIALGAGAFASLVASQILPTFHDARMLRELTQLPVLGTVGLLPSPQVIEKRRVGGLLFAGSVAGLVLLIGAAMILVSLKTASA
jgi:polysaccharide chain length determinant protein (PEP-CTERM system associated)